MKNYFLRSGFVLSFVLVGLGLPVNAWAQVNSFSFTIEPAEILVDLSTVFQVGAFDENGDVIYIDETFDIYLESNSATGYFHSSKDTTEPADKLTMNSNWDSRNFYYHDTEVGEMTIEVRASPRAGGESFETSHTFSVVAELSGSEEEEEENEEGENNDDDDDDDDDNSTTSTHSSPTQSGSVTKKPKLNVDAGRSRLTSENVPMRFVAEVEESEEESGRVNFKWSFGDGGRREGKEVLYTYTHAGDYVVILNATKKDSEAVSRTSVKVVTNNLSLTKSTSTEELVIENLSQDEINIGDFILKASTTIFTFPPDTILQSHKKIILDEDKLRVKITDLTELSLTTPTDSEVATLDVNDENLETQLQSQAENLSDEEVLEDMKAELISLSLILEDKIENQKIASQNLNGVGGAIGNYIVPTSPPAPKILPPKNTSPEPIASSTKTEVKREDSKSKTITIEKPPTFFDKILDWPILKMIN